MKILNLYSGIGGNRKLWGDKHHITSIELHEGIAREYEKLYPNDKLIIGDAKEYLLKNHQDYDLIWVSPPCPTHSRARFWRYKHENPVYPDMTLWEIIIFLKNHSGSKWVVENVKPYYDPLIEPSFCVGRHYFWSNFYVKVEDLKLSSTIKKDKGKNSFSYRTSSDLSKEYDIHICDSSKGSRGYDLNRVLRNCVNPKIGKLIFDYATRKTLTLGDFQ